MHPPLAAGTVAIQLAVVFAIVLVNAFFVASEFALVSVRRTRMDQLAAEGNSSAALVQHVVHRLDRYIAATQVGITVASLMLGGIGEGTLEPLFDAGFAALTPHPALLGVSRAALATGFAYFLMTAMHVIIGELMPKSIALANTDATALLIVRPMVFFARLFTPLIWLLNGAGGFLLGLLGINAGSGHAPVHSAEELDLLFTQSHEGGQISVTEHEILHRVVKFSDLSAREVMVPRVEMQGVPVVLPLDALNALILGKPHTRMPVYRDSMDEIVGVVHLKDLVPFVAALASRGGASAGGASTKRASAEGAAVEDASANAVAAEVTAVDLTPLVRLTARVPETLTIDKLLGEFKKRREQMAIVIDEYGGTSGLITMGDLLQQVFGEVRDEFDEAQPVLQERSDGRIALAGRTLIDEVNERFGTGFRDDEADTVAGLVLHALGRPAVVSDEVYIHGASLRVEAVERLRITALSLLPAKRGNDDDGDGV